MRVLVYKRTHTGDPDSSGVFGIHNCMGTVRGRDYDAVIGIGGKNPWPGDKDLAFRINWVGVGRKPAYDPKNKKPKVSFSHFCLMDDKGPFLVNVAPKLYDFMYGQTKSRHRRVVMFSVFTGGASKNQEIQDIVKEVEGIIDRVKNRDEGVFPCVANQSAEIETPLKTASKCSR